MEKAEVAPYDLAGENVRIIYCLTQCVWKYFEKIHHSVQIDWDEVAEAMRPIKILSPKRCQQLWKQFVYQNPENRPLSDEDSDIDQPFKSDEQYLAGIDLAECYPNVVKTHAVANLVKPQRNKQNEKRKRGKS
mmetsp:Transcript_23481/g.46270  ORF Transcript_23481/g.46270 Transcript_23481/m.46270 type:complete len:133 (-) Transcript_23481:80-478(-)